MCRGIATADVRDERYEVNYCNETEKMPNQKEKRWSRIEWSRVQLFVKAKRWNIVSNVYDIHAIFDNCDQTLFRSSLNRNQCLYHLYPDKRGNTHNMTLRPPWS